MSHVDEQTPLWDREDHGAVTVLTLKTRWLLGPELIQPLRQHLYDLVDKEDRRRIILDFSEVEFFESLFLAVLLGLVKRLHPLEGRLALVGLRPLVAEIFEPLPMSQIGWLRFFPTASDALPWCSSEHTDLTWNL